MLQGRRNFSFIFHPIRVVFVLVCFALSSSQAETVVLYLKNGDKISGFVVFEYTNRVVLSNNWVRELSVPLAEISRREIILAGATNRLTTNTIGSAKPALPTATPPPPPPLFKHWKGEAEVGLDLIYSTSDQRTYHGRFKLAYELPYTSDPKKFFRNTFDYIVEYGKTEQTVNGARQTATSSDKMGASDKTSADFDGHWYAYNLAGIGYDRVRKIELHAEEGPGLGYHLMRLTNFTANVEGGMNYQVQHTTDNTDSSDFFYRLAQDTNWKINPRTTFTEKLEFFPRVNFEEYRLRAEATLSYNLWRYVYLNLTARDSYDTKPAANASANEFEFHSALGVKF